jgi:FKBP-type peptidyl-prolyl cis-trans isomerase FkpA
MRLWQHHCQSPPPSARFRPVSGVVYRVMKKGNMPVLTAQDVIRFKLAERISTGKVISTGEIRRGRVDKLPELMQQGVRLIGSGGKVKMTVPWNLAYGEVGIPGTIPPAVASEITLEILSVEK